MEEGGGAQSSGGPFLPLPSLLKEAPAYNWIFHTLPNEPIKIQPIWFADRNFAFKIFELFPSFSLFRAEVISKESGVGRRWGVHLSASFPSGSVTMRDFA